MDFSNALQRAEPLPVLMAPRHWRKNKWSLPDPNLASLLDQPLIIFETDHK